MGRTCEITPRCDRCEEHGVPRVTGPVVERNLYLNAGVICLDHFRSHHKEQWRVDLERQKSGSIHELGVLSQERW